MIYLLGLFIVAVFALTSVIATSDRNLDIFSVVFLSLMTALGGGTIRDITLGTYPIFWIEDPSYLWVALAASVFSFFGVRYLSNLYTTLLYLDALGIALFSIVATQNTILLGFSYPIAVIMGVVTAILGSMLRDVLAGRPTLLMSKELYATPVLVGTAIYALLYYILPHSVYLVPFCIVLVFLFRALSIFFKISYPSWLCLHNEAFSNESKRGNRK